MTNNCCCPEFDFDLRQLEVFCKVVELGSFSQAADAVDLAQASVSERMAKLERSIGERLFDRVGRKVVASRVGEQLYVHGRKLLELKRHTTAELANFLGIQSGRLDIGGSTIPGEFILPAIMGRFRAQFPEVKLVMSIGDTEAITNGVEDGKYELGVVGSVLRSPHLDFSELWWDELVLAVPANHRWADAKVIDLAELASEPLILREEGSGTQAIFEKHMQEILPGGVKDLKVIARMGSSTAVKQGILAGVGVSILSSRAIEVECKAGVLSCLQLNGFRIQRSFHLVSDKRRAKTPLCKTFMDFLLTDSGNEVCHGIPEGCSDDVPVKK